MCILSICQFNANVPFRLLLRNTWSRDGSFIINMFKLLFICFQPILEKYCPDIVAGGMSCCNFEQVSNLQSSIKLAENILYRCPTCMDNFLKHICALTCATNQSTFLKPVIETFNSKSNNLPYIGVPFIRWEGWWHYTHSICDSGSVFGYRHRVEGRELEYLLSALIFLWRATSY